MDSYDDLCPRCYLNNSKECRDCITKDARRELARELLDEIRGPLAGRSAEIQGGPAYAILVTLIVAKLREIAEEGEA